MEIVILKLKPPELILPAGSFEKLKYAFAYGADAVYAGPPEISLRANLNEFNLTSLKEAILYSHRIKKKIYVTLNIFAHEEDLNSVERYMGELAGLRPDAFIISDPGILNLIKTLNIDIPVHLSTQANTTNSESIKFWQERGVRRIILARELHFSEIQKIREKVEDIELEMFVHGAMCMAYSGRCILSGVMAGRDSNRGRCAQTCRWRYFLVEETRKGEYFEIEQDKRGTYILNSKDLCLIDRIPALKSLNIDGYKIEGRTKNVFYISIAARAYRRAIDDIFDLNRSEVHGEDIRLLNLTDNHGFTYGFTFENDSSRQNVYEKDYKKQNIAGLIEDIDEDKILIRVKNPISTGDRVTGISPDEVVSFTILDMYENGQKVKKASGAQGQCVTAKIDARLTGNGWKFGIIARS